MGVDVIYLDNGQGVLFFCYGVSHGEELKDALKRVVKKKNLENLKYAIIDEAAVTSYKRTGADTLDFVKIQHFMSVYIHDDAIVAVVAPSDEGFKFARAWEAKVIPVGWITKSFRARKEAEAWVKEKMKELFQTDVAFRKTG